VASFFLTIYICFNISIVSANCFDQAPISTLGITSLFLSFWGCPLNFNNPLRELKKYGVLRPQLGMFVMLLVPPES